MVKRSTSFIIEVPQLFEFVGSNMYLSGFEVGERGVGHVKSDGTVFVDEKIVGCPQYSFFEDFRSFIFAHQAFDAFNSRREFASEFSASPMQFLFEGNVKWPIGVCGGSAFSTF